VDRTAVPDRGTGDADAELTGVARELRQRRQLLGLSQEQLSELSGVSRTVINKVEAGARVPSVRTYARLRAALGLEAPPAALIPRRLPTRLVDDRLAALCAGLLANGQAALADLASALEVSIPAVRENLEAVAERLRPIGYCLTDDGGTVRLWPLPGAPSAVVRTLTVTEEEAEPSPEQFEILSLVAYFGQMTRALIEHFRPDDSASVLDRMVRRGLLAKVRSDEGAGGPNVYRVTAKALRAAGYGTAEGLRAAFAEKLTAAEQTLAHAHHAKAPGSPSQLLPADPQ
jgi:chromosome segregation and condensation protein ScpB/DNA-binding XRE family transcriptional regulator